MKYILAAVLVLISVRIGHGEPPRFGTYGVIPFPLVLACSKPDFLMEAVKESRSDPEKFFSKLGTSGCTLVNFRGAFKFGSAISLGIFHFKGLNNAWAVPVTANGATHWFLYFEPLEGNKL